jgi:hypothetical protein
MGDAFDCQYDGILERDFWESKNAAVDYWERNIFI